MEPLIIDAAPKGSAILAYGRARGSRLRFVLNGAAILVGVFFVVLIGAAIVLRTVSFPTHRLITISAVPAKVMRAFGVETVSDFPPSWRAAVRTASKRPAFFGMALRENGTPYTFAFVFGTVQSADGVRMEHEPFRTLLLDNADAAVERVSTFRLFSLMSDLRRADASWAVGANELRAFIGTAEIAAPSNDFRGRWINGRGELDLSSSSNGVASTEDPFVVVLGGNASGSEIVKSAFIAQGIDLREVSAPIDSASFSTDPFFASATFVAPLSGADVSAAAAAFGRLALRNYPLADASFASEFVPATSTDAEKAVSFSTGRVFASPDAMERPNACGGGVIFRLEGVVLQNTLRAVGIPASLAADLHAFALAGNGEKTAICIE